MSGSARAITSASDIDAVGHRVVHGGPHFEDPVVITPEVYSAIASVSAFAPLHIRAELEGMKIVENTSGRCSADGRFRHRFSSSNAAIGGNLSWPL